MLKACDAYADMGQLWRTVPIRKTFRIITPLWIGLVTGL